MSLDRFLTAFETLAAQSVRFVDHVTSNYSVANTGKPDTKAADTKAADTKAADTKPETKKPDPKPETKKPDPKPETKKPDPKPTADPGAPLTDDTVNENGFKYGTLKAAVIAYGAEHGAPATMAILQDLGVSHAKHIEPTLWEQAHARFTAAPAAEESFA